MVAFGVRFAIWCRPRTDTPMQRGVQGRPTTRATHHRRLPRMFKLGIPPGKIARPDEIANAVLFPGLDLASHHRQGIMIDGGATSRPPESGLVGAAQQGCAPSAASAAA